MRYQPLLIRDLTKRVVHDAHPAVSDVNTNAQETARHPKEVHSGVAPRRNVVTASSALVPPSLLSVRSVARHGGDHRLIEEHGRAGACATSCASIQEGIGMSIKNHRVVRSMTDGSAFFIRSDAAIEVAENEGWPPRPQSASLPDSVDPEIHLFVPRERSWERPVACS